MIIASTKEEFIMYICRRNKIMKFIATYCWQGKIKRALMMPIWICAFDLLGEFDLFSIRIFQKQMKNSDLCETGCAQEREREREKIHKKNALLFKW